jgi:hypothetical protein
VTSQGTLATVHLEAGTSREYAIVAIDASGNESADSCFVVAHANLPSLSGWPRALTSMLGPSSLVTADLDHDGSAEVLVGSMWEANAVHVFQADGTEWTDGDLDPDTQGIFARAGDRMHATPLAIDLDGDGFDEIFAGSFDGKVYGWKASEPGAAPEALAGYPVELGSAVRSSPVAADVDGDGELEIVVGSNAGVVHALEFDATEAPGWPRATGSTGFGSTVAISDFDHDGREDLVFGAGDSLYVVSGTGADMDGWPVSLGASVFSCPVLGDVDGDLDLEIFVTSSEGRIFGFHHDDRDGDRVADLLTGWPVEGESESGFPRSPALADFDGDLSPELIVASGNTLRILRSDGTDFDGSPIALSAEVASSPVVADLNGDGTLEILVGTEDRRASAYASDGNVLPGWPVVFLEIPKSTPTVSDLDGDGHLEVLLGSDDRLVRILELDTPATARATPWPGFHGRDRRGVYEAPAKAAIEESAPLSLEVPGDRAGLGASPNPFRASTEFHFILQQEEKVSVEIFDVSGRRVTALAKGDEVLAAGSHRIAWDGRDAAGRAVGSGVYFVRLNAGETLHKARILRIR